MGVRIAPAPTNAQTAAVSTAAAWLLCALLTISQAWQAVELWVFDAFTVATAPRRSALPITIVGIDEASSARIGKAWPWPRDVHAQLIDRLHASGASVIAFDIGFPEGATAAEDRALARAIAAAGHVVLAADRVYLESATARQWRRIDPAAPLLAAGAVAGMRHAVLDDDAVLRQVPQDDDAFWRQVVRSLLRARPGLVPQPDLEADGMMRHLGPAGTFPWVPYHRVLDRDPAIPADFFKDQVVLVGRAGQAGLAASAVAGDSLATPFLRSSRSLTASVEIQATLVENALMGQTVHPASLTRNLGLLGLTLALAGLAMAWWHPWKSPLVLLALAVLVTGASAWLFSRHGLWMATAAPVSGLAAALAIRLALPALQKRRP